MQKKSFLFAPESDFNPKIYKKNQKKSAASTSSRFNRFFLWFLGRLCRPFNIMCRLASQSAYVFCHQWQQAATPRPLLKARLEPAYLHSTADALSLHTPSHFSSVRRSQMKGGATLVNEKGSVLPQLCMMFVHVGQKILFLIKFALNATKHQQKTANWP